MPLHPLLLGLAPNLSARPAGTFKARDFDAYLPTMSLPRVLGVDADAAIPAQVPYLIADPQRLELPERGARRIGLVWAGSPTFGNHRHRSIALGTLARLLDMDAAIEWFSLQKGPAAAQREALPNPDRLQDLGPRLADYGDTAAALAQLDLLISVDTSVAHLAGALAVPTWLLLPFNADWRWQLACLDSPWYPTLRLFRQPRLGDWETVIVQVGEALRSHRTDAGDL